MPRPRLRWFLILALLLAAAGPGFAVEPAPAPAPAPAQPAAAAGSDEVRITVLHFNDTHAHLKPYALKRDGPQIGGISAMAAEVAKMRKEHPNNLLLNAGDVFQGTLFYNFFKGEADYRCLNAMGIDAACLGNHEFDDYQEVLLRTLNLAKFPIVCANLNFSAVTELNRIVKPYIIKEVAGVKIAVIGLTTDDLFILTNPKYLTGVIVNDPLDIVAREIEGLRAQVDLVVVLSHVGLKGELEIAATVDGVDLIVGGHTHKALPKPVLVTNTFGKQVVVNQAGEYTQNLGWIEIAFNRADKSWRYVDGGLKPITPACGSDPAIDAIVDGFDRQISGEVKRVIAKTTGVLEGEKAVTRAAESSLGNLIADALRDHYKADVGLCNGGGIRSSIQGPDVTIENVLEAFPFDNGAVNLKLKGSQLRDAFEHVAKKSLTELYGGFLQVSGVEVVYDKGRVTSLKIGGNDVDPAGVYSVVMSDFMAAGGDGLDMFRDAPEFTDGRKMSDLLIDYMKAKGTLTPKLEGRIVVK